MPFIDSSIPTRWVSRNYQLTKKKACEITAPTVFWCGPITRPHNYDMQARSNQPMPWGRGQASRTFQPEQGQRQARTEQRTQKHHRRRQAETSRGQEQQRRPAREPETGGGEQRTAAQRTRQGQPHVNQVQESICSTKICKPTLDSDPTTFTTCQLLMFV